MPTAAQLVSHILDRLEGECAFDIAHATGEAGEALREACGERSGDDDPHYMAHDADMYTEDTLRAAMRGDSMQVRPRRIPR